GVAHDLGNVLAALAMTVELLLQGDDLAPEVVRGLLELDGEIRRASRLTRQLLLLGRRRSLEAVPVELNALVDDLSVMLRRLLGDAVSLRVASDADALWISGDASMLEQVVANLVVNARDAMPDGGTVDIRMRLVERPAGRANGDVEKGSRSFVMLEVEDTGSGIEPQHVERIFEPYFTTKSEGKGMGIGLATVQGVARQHGGWVEVASVPGRGARFRVMLPAGAPPPAHPAPPG
ncbi:MAG TPA: ATP-binding protein, partial [Gemmatimonadaceae bacterium]|nr:ATP-binding protein [Gemmatimonadaceae bacterium]